MFPKGDFSLLYTSFVGSFAVDQRTMIFIVYIMVWENIWMLVIWSCSKVRIKKGKWENGCNVHNGEITFNRTQCQTFIQGFNNILWERALWFDNGVTCLPSYFGKLEALRSIFLGQPPFSLRCKRVPRVKWKLGECIWNQSRQICCMFVYAVCMWLQGVVQCEWLWYVCVRRDVLETEW